MWMILKMKIVKEILIHMNWSENWKWMLTSKKRFQCRFRYQNRDHRIDHVTLSIENFAKYHSSSSTALWLVSLRHKFDIHNEKFFIIFIVLHDFILHDLILHDLIFHDLIFHRFIFHRFIFHRFISVWDFIWDKSEIHVRWVVEFFEQNQIASRVKIFLVYNVFKDFIVYSVFKNFFVYSVFKNFIIKRCVESFEYARCSDCSRIHEDFCIFTIVCVWCNKIVIMRNEERIFCKQCHDFIFVKTFFIIVTFLNVSNYYVKFIDISRMSEHCEIER